MFVCESEWVCDYLIDCSRMIYEIPMCALKWSVDVRGAVCGKSNLVATYIPQHKHLLLEMYQRRPYQLSTLRSFWNMEFRAIEIAHTKMEKRKNWDARAATLANFIFLHNFRRCCYCLRAVPFDSSRRRYSSETVATKSNMFPIYLFFFYLSKDGTHIHTDIPGN